MIPARSDRMCRVAGTSRGCRLRPHVRRAVQAGLVDLASGLSELSTVVEM